MFYRDLFAALNRRVDYVLIGGLAISLHGIERATMDIDVTVAMTPDNLSALVEMARELGMTPVLPVALENLSDLDQLAQWHRERNLQAFALRAPGLSGVTLDVLLYPPVDYAQIRGRAVTFLAGDIPVVGASIDDLIALKQIIGRPIDLADIEQPQTLEGILSMPFDRSNRTYHVSDDRLRVFRALSPEDKLRWVEQLATFLRLVQPSKGAAAGKAGLSHETGSLNEWHGCQS